VEKIKFSQIVQEVAVEALRTALVIANPMLKDKSDAEVAEMFGFNEKQFKYFADKALGHAITEKVETKISDIFKAGNSVVVHNQFQVYVYESKAYKNEDGSLTKKLSIRTRRRTKELLNTK
jgi:hypothetical protein